MFLEDEVDIIDKEDPVTGISPFDRFVEMCADVGYALRGRKICFSVVGPMLRNRWWLVGVGQKANGTRAADWSDVAIFKYLQHLSMIKPMLPWDHFGPNSENQIERHQSA